MDLVSASVEKLAPLPPVMGGEDEGGGGGGGGGEDATWLEEMEERVQRGSGEAQFSLGQYHFSRGEYEEARRLFELAEGRDNIQAKYQLAVMYYDGLGVNGDPSRGFQSMLEVAQSQRKRDTHLIPSAQYNVGRAYFMGFGVCQSDEEAVKWWREAGEGEEGRGGDESRVRAQNTLGMFYAREESLDLKESFHWHSLAADNGHLESMAAVGMMSLKGHGCARDEEAGLRWMRRAAEGGSVYGTGLLALHYYIRKLFSKAAETAFRVSELGEGSGAGCEGEGGEQSPLDHRGVAMGCFVLARCLQLGQAVSKNDHKAQEYFTKAKKYDKTVVAELHNQLTHGQL